MIIKPQNPEKLEETLKSKPLILYGMGDTGRRIARWCRDHEIQFLWSDQNEELQKKQGSGWIAPGDIVSSFPTANIVIASIVYVNEIMEDLLRLGVGAGQILQPFIFMPDNIAWKDIEDDGCADWGLMQKRFQMIAEWGWIPNDIISAADYGAGHQFLKNLLPAVTVYYPIDFIDRGHGTIVCDFNKREFPDIHTELSACTGALMYIAPAEELISHICRHTGQWIIFSFVTLEGMSDINIRRKSGFCQDFSEQQILDMFAGHNYTLRDKRYDFSGNSTMTLFLFEREAAGVRI